MPSALYSSCRDGGEIQKENFMSVNTWRKHVIQPREREVMGYGSVIWNKVKGCLRAFYLSVQQKGRLFDPSISTQRDSSWKISPDTRRLNTCRAMGWIIRVEQMIKQVFFSAWLPWAFQLRPFVQIWSSLIMAIYNSRPKNIHKYDSTNQRLTSH